MTIRPEFNNGGAIEAVAIVLFKFLSVVSLLSFRWFRFGVSVVPVISVVSFRWFRFGVSGFSTCRKLPRTSCNLKREKENVQARGAHNR